MLKKYTPKYKHMHVYMQTHRVRERGCNKKNVAKMLKLGDRLYEVF